MDFFMVSTRAGKNGVVEVYPRFIVKKKKKSTDLMIRGGDFYAVWLQKKGFWSTEEGDALDAIDQELDAYVEKNRDSLDRVKVLHMWDAQTGMVDTWHKYCQKQLRDSFHMLDEKIMFSNSECRKEDYASKKLAYPLEEGSIEAWDTLISTLYAEEERRKIEWAIGAVVSGESKKLQKFLVLHGDRGTGKSTILNIIENLFGGYEKGYCAAFDAKALGSSNASFALEAFRSNPLVAIQQDGDLSRIEDNTRLNSLVSHESMSVNEKYTKAYTNRFKCFLFMGTNKPVKITDAKSGILRRLIDVKPTGNKIPKKEYLRLTKQTTFELGAIAKHCLDVFNEDPDRYEDYIPIEMLGATNDFYNFIMDSYTVLEKEDGISLKVAWNMYKEYCEEAKVPYPFTKMKFQEELKNYFDEVLSRPLLSDGTRPRTYYKGFKRDKFESKENTQEEIIGDGWLKFYDSMSPDVMPNRFDEMFYDAPAQYANEKEKPSKAWSFVKTTLKDINTGQIHYVLPQVLEPNLLVVDFDEVDADGKKSFAKNLEAASQWPQTYAELSKSGAGIHLHYLYNGDVTTLVNKVSEHVELLRFPGKESLRRRLTKCNHLPIATINPGPSLPIKEVKPMVSIKQVKSQKSLYEQLEKQLAKGSHSSTKCSIDFAKKILDDAYASDLSYDVSDLEPAFFWFASGSTHNARYCQQMVKQMKFRSRDVEEEKRKKDEGDDSAPMVFFDWEVMPNVNLVCYKFRGKDEVYKLINPTPTQIEELYNFNLIGFNNRAYDNHIMWAVLLGYSTEAVYQLSQDIVENRTMGFNDARRRSYADVYDFCTKKQGLKKWEIELGIHHQEFGLPWNEPVPENRWDELAEYCANDVRATEAVFEANIADFNTRKMLASLSGLTVNDTNRAHITQILVGKNKHPNHLYTDLATGTVYNSDGTVSDYDPGVINKFPGYKLEWGDDKKRHNMYRGTDVGFGGYVYAVEGYWQNVALLDVNSMHPTSTIILRKFGDATDIYKEIRDARFAVKNGEFDKAASMLDGKLAPYLNEEDADNLQAALKLILNSTYGIAAASFENPLRDPRDENNIIALRGALFMRTLQDEVEARGFKVVHIKTDSVKIPDATPEIIEFVKEFGRKYGYEFDHEATYDRMCLVNHAVYIAKYITPEESEKRYGYVLSGIKKHFKKHSHPWTATGTQFQVPYVFKTLFSHEELNFGDLCETKSVTKGAIYLDMNERLPDVSGYEKELTKLERSKWSDLDQKDKQRCDELKELIKAGHSYHFIGRVGLFCPIQDGHGGGALYRMQNDKYYAVTGTKRRDGTPYRWLEAETVLQLKLEGSIDETYHDSLAEEAKAAIEKYISFDSFVSEDPLAPYMNIPENSIEEIPFK